MNQSHEVKTLYTNLIALTQKYSSVLRYDMLLDEMIVNTCDPVLRDYMQAFLSRAAHVDTKIVAEGDQIRFTHGYSIASRLMAERVHFEGETDVAILYVSNGNPLDYSYNHAEGELRCHVSGVNGAGLFAAMAILYKQATGHEIFTYDAQGRAQYADDAGLVREQLLIITDSAAEKMARNLDANDINFDGRRTLPATASIAA